MRVGDLIPILMEFRAGDEIVVGVEVKKADILYYRRAPITKVDLVYSSLHDKRKRQLVLIIQKEPV